MAIQGVTEEHLFEILNRELSASQPIKSPEHLFGREQDLERIRTALAMRGRQIFIYGDRGVGKTSLAQTAAYRYQSADATPILTSCHAESTFESVMQDILLKLRGRTPYQTKKLASEKETKSASLAKIGLSFQGSIENSAQIEESYAQPVRDANAAALLLTHESKNHSTSPIAVIDEFDRMESVKERGKFADFLKQLGDQEVPIKFIFCGIADTFDDLLDAHGSAHRYFDGIKVERLNVSSRWEIIDKSASALGLTVDNNVRHRIAAISDGFPYYIHLLCEKLYTGIFFAEDTIDIATPQHLHNAVTETILSIEHTIRRPYDLVTQRQDGEVLERVLWALADHSELTRTQTSIYASHAKVLDMLGQPSVSEKDFTKLLAKLRDKSYDVVRLHKGRRGLNEFKQNIFRGYVRLRAEAKGVQLALDYAPAPDPKRPTIGKIPSGISPLYQRPSFGRTGSR